MEQASGSNAIAVSDIDFARQIIDHLDLEALEAVTSHAQDQLEILREKTKTDEMEALSALAAKYGATLAWPKSRKTGKPRAVRKTTGVLPAKFIDPENPTNRWSGRGRQPSWLQRYVAQGRSPSEFMTS